MLAEVAREPRDLRELTNAAIVEVAHQLPRKTSLFTSLPRIATAPKLPLAPGHQNLTGLRGYGQINPSDLFRPPRYLDRDRRHARRPGLCAAAANRHVTAGSGMRAPPDVKAPPADARKIQTGLASKMIKPSTGDHPTTPIASR
jgi:hypothetical protein